MTAVLGAFVAGYWAYVGLSAVGILGGGVPEWGRQMSWAVWYLAITIPVFWHLGLYTPRTSVLNIWELVTVVKGVALSSAIFLSVGFVLKVSLARGAITLSLLLTMVIAVLARRVLGAVVRRRRLKAGSGRHVIVLGGGEIGRLILKKFVQAPHLHRMVVGFLDDTAPLGSSISCTLDQTTGATFSRPVLGRPEDLPEVARRFGVEELLVDESAVGSIRLRKLISVARQLNVTVGVIPSLEGFRAEQLWMEDLSAIPVLRTRGEARSWARRLTKRALDVVGSVWLLILCAPLWALVLAMIRLESPGPALFRQKRIGKGGRSFEILKFRTMSEDTDRYSRSPIRDSDARITKVGRLLRGAGLDEVPQLLNVLRGEMSLVGPRPEMPFIVDEYTDLQRKRLQAKPGITGLWQLSPDRHSQIHENIEYDLYYLYHQTITMDLAILVETALRTLEIVFQGLVRAIVGPSGRQDGLVDQPQSLVWPGANGTEDADRDRVRQTTVPSTSGYVLLALDQRRESRQEASWPLWVKAVAAVSRRAPVRILAAEPNRRQLDGLLPAASERKGWSSPDIEFVRAVHGGDVDLLVGEARLVITDQPGLHEISRHRGKNVLFLENGSCRFDGDPSSVEGILQEVALFRSDPQKGVVFEGDAYPDNRGAGAPH